MKIAVISTFDNDGGAAIAALRLHKGFLSLNQKSAMIVRYRKSNNPYIYTIAGNTDEMLVEEKIFKSMEKTAIEHNRTDLSNTFLSLPYPGYNLSKVDIIREADIINLHWVARFQSVESIASLLKLGKPVVWTLHDQNAFTGGCHYAAGCFKYQEECRDCPQLKDNHFQIPFHILHNKLKYWHDWCCNLTIVTPSRWLSGCVSESRLFKGLRVETIPNSVEIDDFKPKEKKAAKKELGLDPGQFTLLFGANCSNEKRKGFDNLVEALRYCLQDPKFRGLVKHDGVKILTFGPSQGELKELGFKFQPFGTITGKDKLAALYSASDLFVLPSLEDNLPNTMLESMACGTPVVSFEVGGMPDLIQNGVTGGMAPCFDTNKLGQLILDFAFDDEKRKQMGLNCRQIIEKNFKLQDQAANYLDLFNELYAKNNNLREGSEHSTSAKSEMSEVSELSEASALSFKKEILLDDWTPFWPGDGTEDGPGDAGIFEVYRKSAIKLLMAQMKYRLKWKKRLKRINNAFKLGQLFFKALKKK